MTKSSEVFVVLADTNAISNLSLYVDVCNALGKDLGIDKGSIELELKGQKDVEKSHLDSNYENGLKLYDYLQEKRRYYDSVSILFSRLSEIELLSIFLERVFDRELTRKGIPYRIRRKKPFRVQVDFNYEEEIIEYWEDIKDRLGEYDIEFEYPEKEYGVMEHTIDISQIVSRYVALGPVDLYLYSLGIFKRVDEIYTYDEEFRAIVNSICNRNRNWSNVCDNIQNDLVEYIPSFRDEYEKEGKIDLPKGVKS